MPISKRMQDHKPKAFIWPEIEVFKDRKAKSLGWLIDPLYLP
uniref:Uncharacterized protein n=1 Tax=Talaromyces marneffei PM1 TaxID=1077442 RepID=A0A093XS78_TALMA